jgi:predicted permease
VRSASLSLVGLFNPGSLTNSISVEGYTPPPGPAPGAKINVVSPEYFGTVGMRLVAGRGFTERDTGSAPRVAVVNETFARTFFGGQNPLGRRISVKPTFRSQDAIEIAGVVRDSKYNDLRRETQSMFYLPLYQGQSEVTSIEVRTEGSPLALAAPVRRILEHANPEIEIWEAKTLEGQVDRSLTRERLLGKLSSLFGVLATALAAIGLYGTLSYAVARRTREIGLRMALGATALEIRRRLLGEALRVAAIGLAAGAPLALVAGRLVEVFLYGVAPADPVTLGGSAALMLAVASLAAYLPARRASRIDPMEALRYE